MARPRSTTTAMATTWRTRSATVLPSSTAARATGRLLKRSMMPACKSSAMPNAVVPASSVTFMASTPGTRNWM
jgi:hypothetical protein